ncbi:MAG: glycosyltransferase, partial [Actinobacteria bacterium]|nr:glycosyltransferase [Actinomycetota bacterium]
MRLVCVTGMHRSGTSLVTRVLNLLGVELGPESAMMAATEDNPRGYWEAEVLSDLDNDILEYLGGRWHRLPPFPDGWESAPELETFRRRARAALDELFGDAEVAGFKDPRTSLLLPFWRTVRDVDASVLVVRDPDEVIGSVVRRDGFEAEKAASLWTDHTVAAYVHDPDRHVVVYEELLAAPAEGARAMAAAIGLPEPTDEVLAEIASFADPSLRRNRDHRAEDGPEVRAARDVHRLLVRGRGEPSVHGLLGLLWDERNGNRLREVELRQLNDELGIHQRDLRTALRERDQVRAQLAQRTSDLNRRTNELQHAQRAAERWQDEHDRLANRRVVRLALGAVEPLRPVVRKARELTGSDPTGGRGGPLRAVADKVAEAKAKPHVPATEAEARELQAELTETAPGSDREHGPLVSVLVLNRDGVDHLRRMLPGLARTTYRDLELVVVDNGSSDASVELIRSTDIGAPVTIIENEDNATFSHGNNQALAAASGAYVLLLNNDIEPAVPGWLGHLVDTLEEHDATAVGARLVYPRRPGLDNAGDTVHPDLSLQHRGVHFDGGVDGVPRGRNLGAGEDPLAPVATAIEEVPAVTAACMLVRADVLREVGGLTEG